MAKELKNKSIQTEPIWARTAWKLAFLAIISMAVYLNSLYGDFMLDDEILIQKNPLIHSFDLDLTTYRLTRTLSYALDYSIWGLDPFGYHLSNVLYNTLTVLIVFFLTRRLTGLSRVSFITALLFAVHPIHTDAVSYLSGRRDILSALFYFSGFLCYVKARQERIKWIYSLVVLCYFAGISAKEMAVTLPVMILVYEIWLWLYDHQNTYRSFFSGFFQAVFEIVRRFKWILVGVSIFVSAYLYLILFIQKASSMLTGEGFLWWGGTPLSNFTTVLTIITTYLYKLIFPIVLHVDYHQFPYTRSLDNPRFLLSAMILIILIVFSCKIIKRSPYMTFSIWWFLITLIPVLHIIPHHILMAEHYLYLPSYGFCLLLSVVFNSLYQSDKIRIPAVLFLTLFIGILAVRTIDRNQDWQDVVTLVKDGLHHSQENAVYHFFLGRTYALNGLYRSANDELALSVSPRHNYSDTHAVKALVAFEQGNYKTGVEETLEALKRNPANQMALYNMGYFAKKMGEESIAMEYFARLGPGLEQIQSLLPMAHLYMKGGDLVKAEESLLKRIDVQPHFIEAYIGLADIYAKMLRFDEAIELYHKILRNTKNMVFFQEKNDAKLNIDKIQSSLQEMEALRELYRNSVEAAKEGKPSRENRLLGEIYIKLGDFSMAEKKLKDALRTATSPTMVKLLLAEVYTAVEKYNDAEMLYSELLRSRETLSVEMLISAGVLYGKIRHFEKAKEFFELALDQEPNNKRIQDYNDWAIKLDALLKKSQEYRTTGHITEAALLEAELSVALGKNEEARSILENIHEVEPDSPSVLTALADIYRTMGYPYWRKTIRVYNDLLSLDDRNAEIYIKLGEFYYTEIGDYESALVAFQKALEINPEQPGVDQIKRTVEKLDEYRKHFL